MDRKCLKLSRGVYIRNGLSSVNIDEVEACQVSIKICQLRMKAGRKGNVILRLDICPSLQFSLITILLCILIMVSNSDVQNKRLALCFVTFISSLIVLCIVV